MSDNNSNSNSSDNVNPNDNPNPNPNAFNQSDSVIIESFIQSIINMSGSNDNFFLFEEEYQNQVHDGEEDEDGEDYDSDEMEPLPPLINNPGGNLSAPANSVSEPNPVQPPVSISSSNESKIEAEVEVEQKSQIQSQSASRNENNEYIGRLRNIFRSYVEYQDNSMFFGNSIFNLPKRLELSNYISNIWDITPNDSIINVVRKYYYYHNDYPETLDVASYEYLLRCNCGLIDEENIINSVEIFIHYLKTYNIVLDCGNIVHINTFYMQENRYPDMSELRTYILNLSRMVINPEQYHSDNKVKVSTKNLDKLVPVEITQEGDCCICTEPVQKGTNGYILPCNHIFHSNEGDCIEGTIIKWLSENNKCPMCKTEVKL